jgi:hypothetical protein
MSVRFDTGTVRSCDFSFLFFSFFKEKKIKMKKKNIISFVESGRH